jgi:hypothetical protein
MIPGYPSWWLKVQDPAYLKDLHPPSPIGAEYSTGSQVCDGGIARGVGAKIQHDQMPRWVNRKAVIVVPILGQGHILASRPGNIVGLWNEVDARGTEIPEISAGAGGIIGNGKRHSLANGIRGVKAGLLPLRLQ